MTIQAVDRSGWFEEGEGQERGSDMVPCMSTQTSNYLS